MTTCQMKILQAAIKENTGDKDLPEKVYESIDSVHPVLYTMKQASAVSRCISDKRRPKEQTSSVLGALNN